MSVNLLSEASEAIRRDAPALASDGPWHPAVALAVADWLSRTADLWECGDVGGIQWNHAVAVARAYLGRDA